MPEAPVAPLTHSEKIRAGLAAKRAAADPASEVESGPTGFMSWTQFCNALAVSLVTSQTGMQRLGVFTNKPEEIRKASVSFHGDLTKAYLAVKFAHALGAPSEE